MSIIILLNKIKQIPFEGAVNALPRITEIHNAIAKTVAICNQKYSDQFFYGNAALNRLILLDDEIAPLLSPDVLHYLFTQPPTGKEKIQRNSTGLINLSDALFCGLSEGLRLIEYLPNNESDYSPKHYSLQKEKFKKNTLTIIKAIETLAGARCEESALECSSPLKPVYEKITLLIDQIMAFEGEATLLEVPGYTPTQIKKQVGDGFLKASSLLGIKNVQDITLEAWVALFLTHEDTLLDGNVSHLFYDRAHLLGALIQKNTIRFKDGRFFYRDIIKAMLIRLDEHKDTAISQVAREQLTLRMNLVSMDLETRPQLAIFREAIAKKSPADDVFYQMLNQLLQADENPSLPIYIQEEKYTVIMQIISSCAMQSTPPHIERLNALIHHEKLAYRYFSYAQNIHDFLCYAALAGNVEGAKLLLSIPLIKNNANHCLRPFFLPAVEGGNLELVQFLLESRGVEAAVDMHDCHALKLAIKNQNQLIIQHLLSYNPIYKYALAHHKSLDLNLDEYVHQQASRLLNLKKSSWNEATCITATHTLAYLITQCQTKDLKIIERLLQVKPLLTIIAQQAPLESLLTLAAKSGNIFVVHELLKHPQIASKAGARCNTALIIAAQQEKEDVVRLLMQEPSVLKVCHTPNFTHILAPHIKKKPKVTEIFLEHPYLFHMLERMHIDFHGDIQLHAQKLIQTIQDDAIAFASVYPGSVYEIPKDYCQALLVLLRHLIRKNNPQDNDTIRFILSLDTIKKHLSEPIFSRHNNTLIRQALKVEHHMIITSLMSIIDVMSALEEKITIPWSEASYPYYLAYARQPRVFRELTRLGFNLSNKEHLPFFDRFCRLAEEQSGFLMSEILVPIITNRLESLNPDALHGLFQKDHVSIIKQLLNLTTILDSAEEKTLFSIIELSKKQMSLIHGPNPKAETTTLLEALASSLTKTLLPEKKQINFELLPKVYLNQFHEIEFELKEPLFGFTRINLFELINQSDFEQIELPDETIACLGQVLQILASDLGRCSNNFSQPKSELFKRLPYAINLALHYYTRDDFFSNANRMFRGERLRGSSINPNQVIIYFLINTLIAVGLNRLSHLIDDEDVYVEEKAVIEKLKRFGSIHPLIRSSDTYEIFLHNAYTGRILTHEEYTLLQGRYEDMQPLLGGYSIAIRGADLPNNLTRHQVSLGKTNLPVFSSASVGTRLAPFFQSCNTHISFCGIRKTAMLTQNASHDTEKEILLLGKALVGCNYLQKQGLFMHFFTDASPKHLLDYQSMVLNKQLRQTCQQERQGMIDVFNTNTASPFGISVPNTPLKISREGKGVSLEIKFRYIKTDRMFWIKGKKQWIASLCTDLYEQPYADEPFHFVQSKLTGLMAWHTEYGSMQAQRLFILTPVILEMLKKHAALPYQEALNAFTIEEIACLSLAMFLYNSGRSNSLAHVNDTSNLARSAIIFEQVASELEFNHHLVKQINYIMTANLKPEQLFTNHRICHVTENKIIHELSKVDRFLAYAFVGDSMMRINKIRLCSLIMHALSQIERMHYYPAHRTNELDDTLTTVIHKAHKRGALIHDLIHYHTNLRAAVGDVVNHEAEHHEPDTERLISMVNNPLAAFHEMSRVALPQSAPPSEHVIPTEEMMDKVHTPNTILQLLSASHSFFQQNHLQLTHKKYNLPHVRRLQTYVSLIIEYFKHHAQKGTVAPFLLSASDLSIINILCSWNGNTPLPRLFQDYGMPLPDFLRDHEDQFQYMLFGTYRPQDALDSMHEIDIKINNMAIVILFAKAIDNALAFGMPRQIHEALDPFEQFITPGDKQKEDLRKILKFSVELIHAQGEQCSYEQADGILREKKSSRKTHFSILERHPKLLNFISEKVQKPTLHGPKVDAFELHALKHI